MKPKDLASEKHWSARYNKVAQSADADWVPADYDSRTLRYAIERGLGDMRPHSILEVGCGNSHWLPYLGKRFGADVAGIDYSPLGCKQAENQLRANGVNGKIYCVDMFSADCEAIGQFDLVYSLGLVEHFDDLGSVLNSLLRFVRPGGTLFTEVPNLASVHGVLSRIYQPAVLAKHQIITLKLLKNAHSRLGLELVRGDYVGLFSLNLVAWGVEPRWPAMDRYFLPIVRKAVQYTDRMLCKVGGYSRGSQRFSPFIYVSGRKPNQ